MAIANGSSSQIVVILKDGQPVTTSFAIAEGTSNQHRAVIQLVRTYQADLEEFGRVAFEMQPFSTAGGTQSREVAILNEQQATLIITYLRNNEVVRAFKKRLVKAFFDLAHQAQPALPDFTNPAAAARAWAEQYEARAKLEAQNQALLPKADFCDRVTVADGCHTIAEAAKILRTGERRLFDWLREQKILMSNRLPYQSYLERGLFRVVETPFTDPAGRERLSAKTVVTGKGMVYLQSALDRLALAGPVCH